MIFNNPQDICDFYISAVVAEGDTVIDATVGNGNDTKKLSDAVGEGGRVYGFDIQPAAIASAKLQNYTYDNVSFFCESHAMLDKLVEGEVSFVIFNLGYLPGGDHSVMTRAESTISAIGAAMRLLRPGGVIVLVIYCGGDTGFGEKDAVEEYLKDIDYRKFNAVHFEYSNRPKNPPSVAVIQKKKS